MMFWLVSFASELLNLCEFAVWSSYISPYKSVQSLDWVFSASALLIRQPLSDSKFENISAQPLTILMVPWHNPNFVNKVLNQSP